MCLPCCPHQPYHQFVATYLRLARSLFTLQEKGTRHHVMQLYLMGELGNYGYRLLMLVTKQHQLEHVLQTKVSYSPSHSVVELTDSATTNVLLLQDYK